MSAPVKLLLSSSRLVRLVKFRQANTGMCPDPQAQMRGLPQSLAGQTQPPGSRATYALSVTHSISLHSSRGHLKSCC